MRETNARPKAILFLDAENQTDLDLQDLMQRLQYYQFVEKHAFADWRSRRLSRLASQLAIYDFEMHHAPSGFRPGALKDTADGYMERGAHKALRYRSDVQTVVIVSGDAFFCPLVHTLRNQGKRVIVAGDPLRMSRQLIATAHRYLPIGQLARTLVALDHLERTNKYLTFSFAADRLDICRRDLSQLIEREYVLQACVTQPSRGTRPQIWLNRQSEVVQSVTQTAERPAHACTQNGGKT